MQNFINEIIELLPDTTVQIALTVLTGVITFFFGRITIKPNDNVEVTYDKVYSPLYMFLEENSQKKINEIDYLKFRDMMSDIIANYAIYVDPITNRLFAKFNEAINANDMYKIAKIYKYSLSKNITANNNKLRKSLGYLQPTFFQYYIYMSYISRFLFNSAMLLVIIIELFVFAVVLKEHPNVLRIIVSAISLFFSLFLVNCLMFLWQIVGDLVIFMRYKFIFKKHK